VQDGRILERGTHQSLYAAQGRYFELYTRQHAVETNLFLAPGEGDKIESAAPDNAVGSGNASTSLPEAFQALRNRNV
jgi:subfamily B ATP-binding cassette protein MsbA